MAYEQALNLPTIRLLSLFSLQFALVVGRAINRRSEGCPSNICVAFVDTVPTTATNNTHGGFTTAIIVGIALATAFVVFLLMTFCYYCIYYKHAQLKLLKEYVERLDSLGESLFHQRQAITGPEVAHDNSPSVPNRERLHINTQSLGQSHALAMLMASSAQLSPDVYSALHKTLEESMSPTSVAESKMRAFDVEDKVLGQCRDIRPIAPANDSSSGLGRSSTSRTRPPP